jgi:RND family efflux transporter MFP subunit
MIRQTFVYSLICTQRWVFPALLAFVTLATQTVIGQITSTFTEPFEQCDVAASESGVVLEIRVTEGSTVKKGDILGVLNDGVFQEAEKLAKMRAESVVRIRSAEAVQRLKKQQLDNLIKLSEKGHANPAEIDQASIQYETALSEVEMAKELQLESRIELEKIQAEIEQRLIRSPIDGVVTKIHKDLGEYIAATDPVFCTVVRLDKLRANFYLEEKVIAAIRSGDVLQVSIGDNKRPENATVLFRSPIIDPKSSTGRIEVEIDNPQGELMSGIKCVLFSPSPKVAHKTQR